MATRVLHLTDCHLVCDPEARLKGVPTAASLRELLTFVKAYEECDFAVITGDLAHDGRLETYQLLREVLNEWIPDVRLIPGNHDNRLFLRQTFPEIIGGSDGPVTFSQTVGVWRLIGLDSHVPGQASGAVEEEQIEWLVRELSAAPQSPTVLFVHHPPISVNSPWLDRIGLAQPGALLDVITQSPQIRVLCAGHVHQEFSSKLGEAEVLTTPATSFQFRPRQEIPILEAIPTGFRVLTLDAGGYQTRVVRLPELTYPPTR